MTAGGDTREADGQSDELRLALEHSWAWFALHAGQRMQLVNFMLAAAAFLVAGYGTALQAGATPAAGAIACLGIVIAGAFWRLDVRTRQLVLASEGPLEMLQHRLAVRAQLNELNMVRAVSSPGPLHSYRTVLRLLTASLGGFALAGALYAFFFFTPATSCG